MCCCMSIFDFQACSTFQKSLYHFVMLPFLLIPINRVMKCFNDYFVPFWHNTSMGDRSAQYRYPLFLLPYICNRAKRANRTFCPPAYLDAGCIHQAIRGKPWHEVYLGRGEKKQLRSWDFIKARRVFVELRLIQVLQLCNDHFKVCFLAWEPVWESCTENDKHWNQCLAAITLKNVWQYAVLQNWAYTKVHNFQSLWKRLQNEFILYKFLQRFYPRQRSSVFPFVFSCQNQVLCCESIANKDWF